MNIHTGLIYRNPKPHLSSRHAYFPSLATLPDGRLLAGFDLGSAFEAVDVRSYYAISSDGGDTWSSPEVLPQPPFSRPFSCTCRLSVSPSGTVVGVGALFDRTRTDEGLANGETGGFVETHPYLIRSEGSLSQWQATWLEAPLAGPFEMCSPVFFASDGSWLCPTSTWKDWNGHAPEGMHTVVMHSMDEGKSWNSWNTVMDGRANDVVHWEIKLERLTDGRILAVSWTHDARAGADRPIHYALSADEGRTFSPPASTGLIGQTCTPLVLADGRILSIYRRMDRPGLWAQVSTLTGSTWTNEDDFLLWAGASHATEEGASSTVGQMSGLRFGLPAAKLLPDGSVFIAFWCVEDAVSNIRYFKLRPPA